GRAPSAARPPGPPPRSAGRARERPASRPGSVRWSAMALYDAIAELPLKVDGYSLQRLARMVSSGFERVSTVYALEGGGETGKGEDVTYEAGAQEARVAAGPGVGVGGGVGG